MNTLYHHFCCGHFDPVDSRDAKPDIRRNILKFLHTSDLHIGKKIFETSLLKEQKAMLDQIFGIAVREAVDALVIAGDVYDRSMPAVEAVTLLDEFLTRLAEKKIPVIMISGNHDSPERVGFADKILEKQGIYIAGTYDGTLRKVELTDAFGKVVFVCLPFVKPAVTGGTTCAEAVENILKREAIDFQDGNRYVLVTHYFVTGASGEKPQLSEAETGIDVGGIDNVPANVFEGFHYVALGHIHKAQQISGGPIYYSGAPMKYAFSEAGSSKYVNLVELDGNGEVSIIRKAVMPLHEMRCIKGELAELIREDVVNALEVDRLDYIQATLTNREELINPIGTLRSVYPNVLQILLEKNYHVTEETYESKLTGERKSTEELFAGFYRMLTGRELDERQWETVRQAAREAEE